MQWLRAFSLALSKGPARELTEKSPCDDLVLLAAQTLHTDFVRSGTGGPRNVQMALAAVVALRAALTHSPHNAELRLEVIHRNPFPLFMLFFACVAHPPPLSCSSFRFSLTSGRSAFFSPSTGSSMSKTCCATLFHGPLSIWRVGAAA